MENAARSGNRNGPMFYGQDGVDAGDDLPHARAVGHLAQLIGATFLSRPALPIRGSPETIRGDRLAQYKATSPRE